MGKVFWIEICYKPGIDIDLIFFLLAGIDCLITWPVLYCIITVLRWGLFLMFCRYKTDYCVQDDVHIAANGSVIVCVYIQKHAFVELWLSRNYECMGEHRRVVWVDLMGCYSFFAHYFVCECEICSGYIQPTSLVLLERVVLTLYSKIIVILGNFCLFFVFFCICFPPFPQKYSFILAGIYRIRTALRTDWIIVSLLRFRFNLVPVSFQHD